MWHQLVVCCECRPYSRFRELDLLLHQRAEVIIAEAVRRQFLDRRGLA